MNAKTVTITTLFAALAVVLNLSPLKIPAPYAPFLIYQIWEIPIVAAFLLYGAMTGFLITIINTLLLLAIYPGALPAGPFYNMAAILSMLLGIGLMKIFLAKHSTRHDTIIGTLFTAAGGALRTALMTLLNYALLRFPWPIGFNMPQEAIIVYIPLIAVFNFTLALYTIPIGYSSARIVKDYAKT
jgi:riboflavin transporter FmnP